jgi:hypothetical protein
MASTYSPTLRLTLQGTGDNPGSWGDITNTNLGTLIEQAITGYGTITVSDAGDTTLTALDGLPDQSRNMYLNLTGAITGVRNVVAPSTNGGLPVTKMYIVKNGTTGGQSVVIKTSAVGSTGVTVPNGATLVVWSDGTNVTTTTTYLPAISGTAITNSTINSTPIGSTVPSSGNFTSGSYQTLNITTGGSLTGVTLANATGTFTSATINAATITGGSINGTTIGSIVPSTGAFSTLTSTGGALNGTIGAATPNSGVFTTLASSGLYTNTVADGSSPMSITSTTRVSNLNVARSGFTDTTTITASSTNATFFPVFASATSGAQVSNTNANYTFNPSTGALSISGTLTANAASLTTPLPIASGGTGNATGYLAPRVVTVASATSITPNANTSDQVYQLNTTSAGSLTINAPTGTPVDGQKLILRINCTNAQVLSFNAIYSSSSSLGFPASTTGTSKTDYLGFIYNSATTKWNFVAQVLGF